MRTHTVAGLFFSEQKHRSGAIGLTLSEDTNLLKANEPVLIGCCPSSGSTLLSVILDAHPALMCGPELSLFAHPFFWQLTGAEWRSRILRALRAPNLRAPNWSLDHGSVPYEPVIGLQDLHWYGQTERSFKRLLRRSNSAKEFTQMLFEPLLKERGKLVWLEKSPPNIYGMPSFLEVYPQGKGVVIVRDGRDVVCSLKRRGLSLSSAISIWLIETAMSLGLSNHPRVHLLRYEDLVLSSTETLSLLTDFLAIEYSEEHFRNYTEYTHRKADDPRERISTWQHSPFEGIQSTSLNRWKTDLPEEELEIFYAHRIEVQHDVFPLDAPLPPLFSMELLSQLGYDVPETQPFRWESYIHYLTMEEHALAHITQRGGLHRRNTRLAIPEDVETEGNVNCLIEGYLLAYHRGQKKLEAEVDRNPFINLLRMIVQTVRYVVSRLRSA